jgi:hypothetical protein
MKGGTRTRMPFSSTARLVGRGGRLALHHRVGLGDLQHDLVGQLDADRLSS